MTGSNITGFTISVIFVLFLSALMPFFSLLIPLPFLFYSSKLGLNQGIKIGFFSLLVVGILTKIIGGYPDLLLMGMVFGIAGFIISEIFRRGYSFSLTIFWGTTLMFLLVSGFIFFIALSRGMTPVEMIINDLQINFDKVIEQFEQSVNDKEVIAQLRELFGFVLDRVKKTYPSLFIVGAGFVVWLNVVLSKPLFIRKGVRYPDLGSVDAMMAPEHVVWGLIAAGFSFIFSIKYIEFFALNALIVFAGIYAFYGFSILIFFFNRYNVPRWMRLAVYILIVLQQLFFVLALAGLFDQWVDFRKIKKNRSESS